MSYIDHIRALEDYLEINTLSPEAQLIYYKLLTLFNRAHWPESIQVDNNRLQTMSGIENERTFRRHKDKLVATGLVLFTKGRPGNPNRYILPLAASLPPEPKPVPKPQHPEEQKETPKPKKSAKKKPPATRVFIPPTKDEVREYCRSRVSTVDPDYFWEYFNASGWIDSKGKPVLNWKGKLVTWEKFNGGSTNTQNDAPKAPPSEPKGRLVTRIDAFGRKKTVWVAEED